MLMSYPLQAFPRLIKQCKTLRHSYHYIIASLSDILDMSEYIGNYIEIIDQSGRSYRGVLSAISAETATVDLSSVDIYDQSGKLIEQKPSVHFQGRDVKDLKLLAKKKPQKNSSSQNTQSSSVNDDTSSYANDDLNSSNTDANTDNQLDSDVEDDDEPSVRDDDFYSRTQRLASKNWTESFNDRVECVYDQSASFFDDLEPTNFNRQKQPRTFKKWGANRNGNQSNGGSYRDRNAGWFDPR